MTRLQRPRKGNQGRKNDPAIAAGTRRARGRLIDPAPPTNSRHVQLVAAMTSRGLTFADALTIWAEVQRTIPNCYAGEVDYGADFRLIQLASDYRTFEGQHGGRLPVFTAAELRAIVAGNGPVTAPWPGKSDRL